MKNSVKITALFLALCTGGLMQSCNDADYSTLGAQAFISESTSTISRSTKVTITDAGVDIEVTASLSESVSHDVKLRFEVDESVLEAYNKSQSTSFAVLPSTNYELDPDVTIEAGAYSASATRIHINPIADELIGESYAIPLRLVTVEGGVPTTPQTSTYVITTESVTTSSLPMFTGTAGLVADGFPVSLPQFTVECRFQVSNTSNRNRSVFTNGNGILLRFEDPQSDSDGVPAHSLVQFQGDGWYLNPLDYFRKNVWQHLALTYDGKAVRIYVNGAFAGTKDGVCAADFTGAAWFGGDAGGGHGTGDPQWWRNCKILCSELRIWSVVRTDTQIQNNMVTTSASSEGLEAYWRMDKENSDSTLESGTTLYTFEDLTKKGHTLKTQVAPQWVDNILSTDTSTAWPQ